MTLRQPRCSAETSLSKSFLWGWQGHSCQGFNFLIRWLRACGARGLILGTSFPNDVLHVLSQDVSHTHTQRLKSPNKSMHAHEWPEINDIATSNKFGWMTCMFVVFSFTTITFEQIQCVHWLPLFILLKPKCSILFFTWQCHTTSFDAGAYLMLATKRQFASFS